MKKIALLSNINMDPVVAQLREEYEVLTAAGYGNIFEELLQPSSPVCDSGTEAVFILTDIQQLCLEYADPDGWREAVDGWFAAFEGCIRREQTYFIADADCREEWFTINRKEFAQQDLEQLWYERLKGTCLERPNVHIFPYKKLAARIGKERFYSRKLWYLGRIAHSAEGRNALAEEIGRSVKMLETPKKALLLDLDNTLWGGVVGEAGPEGIVLSDEKKGLVYKTLQRVIKRMKETGVILGIVSKNNEADAMDVIRHHPHMILREEDFSVFQINWEPKDVNIREAAAELNIGTDSIVFFDDSPAERELVRSMLPEVETPDFPEAAEQLPEALTRIFETYFEKWVYTAEDAEKTRQYRANAKRNELKKSAVDYGEYIRSLEIRIDRVDPAEHKDRLLQLIQKTNQFNLTSVRLSAQELERMLEDGRHVFFLYEVSDRFGNNGITAAVAAALEDAPEGTEPGREAAVKTARIEEFILSCRIMGRRIEYTILEQVERELFEKGVGCIYGRYVFTQKSRPAESFYESAGYELAASDERERLYRKPRPEG